MKKTTLVSSLPVVIVSWAFFGLGFNAAFGQSPRLKAEDALAYLAKDDIYVATQLITPDFQYLPLDRKLFAYHLHLGIAAGADIAWKQASPNGLRIRNLLQAIRDNAAPHENPQVQRAIDEYGFRLIALKGNYDANTNAKILLAPSANLPKNISKPQMETLIYSGLMEMAKRADHSLLTKGGKAGLTKELAELTSEIFDANYHKNYHAPDGQDLLNDSNTGYYDTGITMEAFKKLSLKRQNHFLSFPTLLKNGKIHLRLHAIGPRRRFGKELSAIRFHLKNAAQYGNGAEREIIDAYIKSMETGNPNDLLAAERLWVQYKATDIEFQMGFIEVYADPKQTRGAWEGFIVLIAQDPITKERARRIKLHGDEFEGKMPVEERFKRAPGGSLPDSQGVFMVYSGGDNGYRPFLGVNLPNDRDISKLYGTKSFTNVNVSGKGTLDRAKAKVFYTKEHLRVLNMFTAGEREIADQIQVEFHEMLGHGSSVQIQGAAQENLESYQNPLEEARAETASLYQLLDIDVRNWGLVDESWSDKKYYDFARLNVLNFFAGHIRSFGRLADDSTAIRQAHQWARQVMLNWLIKDGQITVIDSTGGVPQISLTDASPTLNGLRNSLGDLWAVIQTAKSEADPVKAKNLFDVYGNYSDRDRKIRRHLKKAELKLGPPGREWVALNPQFNLVIDGEGNVKDVTLRYLDKTNDPFKALFEKSRKEQELNEAYQASCRQYF